MRLPAKTNGMDAPCAPQKFDSLVDSRPGRPPIPQQLQALIRRMANENPSWGEERIANELLLKLGIKVSPRTVSKYLPTRPTHRPRGDMRWSTFLRLHAQGIIACDFFLAVTVSFRQLYVFVVRAQQSAADSLQRHHAYDCGLDAATAARGRRV